MLFVNCTLPISCLLYTSVDNVTHLRVCPYGKLHLTAVHATVTGEVEHHGLAMLAGILHTEVVIVELGMHFIIVKIEILRLHGRRKSTDSLQRSSPQTRNHIHRKCQRGQRHEETGYTCLLYTSNNDDPYVKTLCKADEVVEAKAAIRKEHVHPERLMKALFNNEDYVNWKVDAGRLMTRLFDVASNMQSLDTVSYTHLVHIS